MLQLKLNSYRTKISYLHVVYVNNERKELQLELLKLLHHSVTVNCGYQMATPDQATA
jgi:hypothetical protein